MQKGSLGGFTWEEWIFLEILCPRAVSGLPQQSDCSLSSGLVLNPLMGTH